MKILHITSSYWPAFEFGRPIQSVYLLNKHLVKKGIEVMVYTTNAGLKKRKEKKRKDIPLKKEVFWTALRFFISLITAMFTILFRRLCFGCSKEILKISI